MECLVNISMDKNDKLRIVKGFQWITKTRNVEEPPDPLQWDGSINKYVIWVSKFYNHPNFVRPFLKLLDWQNKAVRMAFDYQLRPIPKYASKQGEIKMKGLKGELTIYLNGWVLKPQTGDSSKGTSIQDLEATLNGTTKLNESNELADAKKIIAAIKEKGYAAYLVGGCVRDMLLGKTPKDYDVATNATPDQLLEIFPKANKIGAHFGVVIVDKIEIATFRSDGEYGDGRRPDSVHFENDPRRDAERRDFTINAMFLDPITGVVLDFFGGREDLKNKVIRTVGNADDRFEEDRIRMLRAVRFAAKLGFEIAPEVKKAITKYSHEIKGMSAERIHQEIFGALAHGDKLASIAQNLIDTGLMETLFKAAFKHSKEVMKAVAVIEKSPNPGINFLALLMHFEESPMAKLRSMKCSNEEVDYIEGTLTVLPQLTSNPEKMAKHTLIRILKQKFFVSALVLAESLGLANSLTLWKQAFKENRHLLAMKRLIDGEDLKSIGVHPGPVFKRILNDVEDAQFRGEIQTKEEALSLAQAIVGKI